MWFTNKDEKALADKELEIYKAEKKLQFDREMFSARETAAATIIGLKKQNVDDAFEAEHEYHHNKQERGIELAKIEAEIATGREVVVRSNFYDKMAASAASEKARADAGALVSDELRKEVARLDELVKFIAGLLPKVELDKIGVTLNADIHVNKEKETEKK